MEAGGGRYRILREAVEGHLIPSEVDLRKVVLEVMVLKLRPEELMSITQVKGERIKGMTGPEISLSQGREGIGGREVNSSYLTRASQATEELGLFPEGSGEPLRNVKPGSNRGLMSLLTTDCVQCEARV